MCTGSLVWEKAEGRQDVICITLVKKDCCNQLSTSTVEMMRCEAFNFNKEHIGKSEQIAWEGCEDTITEGV